ncbi:putative IMP dehydrogenase / GMP reductase domain containing protein [Lyophyllum shimeji]|uniref:IMP dehydrogenase / GMP reductase domain containing protein n=1 Tax=Lyophyllum shimeji TaxID=47721 RepID=A0A9P3PFM3_LYOSH|nr:putative IMP dehydrogenase / GMP reductase domain containing protein [Lyophyllum shimeji]
MPSSQPVFSTPLTRLFKINHPIMLAGMNVAAGPKLAAAVTNAGGIGVIGGVRQSPKFLQGSIDELKSHLEDKNAPFGVDLLIPQVGGSARKTNRDYTDGQLPELIDVIVRNKASLFVCAVGVPPKWAVDKLHAAGIPVMNMIGHPKHVAKALAQGVDIICAQGGEGGGHTGDTAFSILIPAVVDLCKGKTSPLTGEPVIVVAAGGIADGRGLAAALAYGASGVWVGTRFVASVEAGAPPKHKEMVLTAGYDDVTRTLIYSGRPMSVRRTPYVAEWETKRRAEMEALLAEGKVPHEVELQNHPERSIAGFQWLMGRVAGSINDVKPAKEIVDDLVTTAAASLKNAQGLIRAKFQGLSYYLAIISALGLVVLRLFHYYLRGKPPDYSKLSGVPHPSPLRDFDIDKAKPRPYRPFRWEYHQHMALKKMEPDWWIELESTYRERIAQRKQLYAEYGKAIIDALPGSEQACKELKEMVIQFLCARYPNQFQVRWGAGVFFNRILGTRSKTRTVDALDALEFLLDHVPEDFLITLEDERTGLYVLRAAVSCSAVGWRLQEKMGRPLHEIHEPVPDYKEKMQFSMDRYFSKMPCDKPIQRGSWSFEIGQPLYSQPGDPHYKLRESQTHELRVEDVCLRVDWQTLRRLPRSRAIVFNFKALFTPVTHFREEPYIPKLVAKILREGRKPILEYKSTRHVEHRLLPALDLWAMEQEEKGWVPKDWKERTLDEDPYFPGWENTK